MGSLKCFELDLHYIQRKRKKNDVTQRPILKIQQEQTISVAVGSISPHDYRIMLMPCLLYVLRTLFTLRKICGVDQNIYRCARLFFVFLATHMPKGRDDLSPPPVTSLLMFYWF